MARRDCFSHTPLSCPVAGSPSCGTPGCTSRPHSPAYLAKLSLIFCLFSCSLLSAQAKGEDEDDADEGKHALWFFGFSFLLLFWNEGHLVRRLTALDETRKRVCQHQYDLPLDPLLDGELLHMCGTLQIHDSIEDDDFGCRVDCAAQLQRKVDIYQWVETKKVGKKKTRYSYALQWVSKPIDSTRFHVTTGHVNKHGGWNFQEHGDQQLCTKNATFGFVWATCKRIITSKPSFFGTQPFLCRGYRFPVTVLRDRVPCDKEITADHVYAEKMSETLRYVDLFLLIIVKSVKMI